MPRLSLVRPRTLKESAVECVKNRRLCFIVDEISDGKGAYIGMYTNGLFPVDGSHSKIIEIVREGKKATCSHVRSDLFPVIKYLSGAQQIESPADVDLHYGDVLNAVDEWKGDLIRSLSDGEVP